MKNITTTFLTICLLFIYTQSDAQTWSHKRSVEAYATINAGEPSITLHWNVETNSQSYAVFRRELGSNNWGSPIANLAADDSSFKDNNIDKHTIYEYSVVRTCTDIEPFSITGAQMEAYGFVTSGIELNVIHFRGELLLLVSRLIYDSLSAELDILSYDLIGDGWNVSMAVVEDSDSVPSVKQMILNKYESDEGLDAIYLLGHIPVPYSGAYCDNLDWNSPPDGHGSTDPNSHCGAWTADVYYGSPSNGWTDEVIADRGKRTENQNYIGDGKFDNIILPDSVRIPVGRVDLSSLPKFTESEVELTRRYLQKSHNYKYAMFKPIRMGIIEDNFSGMSEGFSSGAWRDFTAELGPNKILEEDLFLTTDSGLYLFNYVCGAGFYTSCNGLGTTDSFKMNNPAVFNHMFGSFFGDFDIANNIGRASLAAPDNGLIWIWSGRPKWLTHTLAIGETIGQCALRTQNNDWNYGVSFYQNQAHVALNGDPSIRSAMFEPATSLGIGTNSEKTRVNLSWTASTAQDVTGYYIYWSNNEFGPYLLLNQTPESGSSFTHYTPEFGSNYYMIRAERLEITGSATYYNLSQGQFISIDSIERTTSIPPTIGIPFTVYPVPTDDHLMVRFSDAQPREIRVLNLQGQVVLETKVLDSTVRLNVSEYPRGLYFVEVNGQRRKFIKS